MTSSWFGYSHVADTKTFCQNSVKTLFMATLPHAGTWSDPRKEDQLGQLHEASLASEWIEFWTQQYTTYKLQYP